MKSANCGKGISHKAIKYSISTFTLYFIKASSEKNGAKFATLLLYLPSIGEMAFKLVKDICKFYIKNTKLMKLT